MGMGERHMLRLKGPESVFGAPSEDHAIFAVTPGAASL